MGIHTLNVLNSACQISPPQMLPIIVINIVHAHSEHLNAHPSIADPKWSHCLVVLEAWAWHRSPEGLQLCLYKVHHFVLTEAGGFSCSSATGPLFASGILHFNFNLEGSITSLVVWQPR